VVVKLIVVMKYKDAFGAEPTGKAELHVGQNEGVTEQGDYVFPARTVVNGKIITEGKVLYFRNNTIDELDFDKAAADGYAKLNNAGLSRDGKWMFVRGKNTINTEGFGQKAI
jgi:hypothetical protein